jgi:hypothetical protein
MQAFGHESSAMRKGVNRLEAIMDEGASQTDNKP